MYFCLYWFIQVSFQSWLYNQDWSLFIYNKNVITVRMSWFQFQNDIDVDDCAIVEIITKDDDDADISDERGDKDRGLMKSWIGRGLTMMQ